MSDAKEKSGAVALILAIVSAGRMTSFPPTLWKAWRFHRFHMKSKINMCADAPSASAVCE